MIKLLVLNLALACAVAAQAAENYYDHQGRDDIISGGVKMVAIETPQGVFKVWTKRTGNNPGIKLLLLHGGPAATHEYFEVMRRSV